MQFIRALRLPTGLTMVMGCGWPGEDGGRAGGAGAEMGMGARAGAHAAAGAGADGPEEGMDAAGMGRPGEDGDKARGEDLDGVLARGG
jgi:hypothetical protein